LFVENRTNDVDEPGRPSGFYWHVVLHPSVKFNGPLVFTETRADFSRP
jgi:hypothetical protein